MNTTFGSLRPTIQSKPVVLDSKLKGLTGPEQKQEDERVYKVSKLVDQFRVLCKQPTSKEMSKKDAVNFRRPTEPEKPKKQESFLKRSEMVRS